MAAATASASNGAVIQEFRVPPMPLREATIHIVGTSPLIVHAWSSKAKEMMLSKQTKAARTARQARNVEEEYRNSLYIYDGQAKPIQYGFPAVAFKASAASAFNFVDGLKKTVIRGAFHIVNGHNTDQGSLVRIISKGPTKREDMVKIGMGTADLRYRAQFLEWRADLRCSFNQNVLSLEALVNLFKTAGFSVGIGEWRPEKDGDFGMFTVQGVTDK